ncbi:MAG TPA: hypothetical protein VG101_13650 [Puia sp.]|jgi:hypothetical protein|nr:hypothetical protein [Puia sp.]
MKTITSIVLFAGLSGLLSCHKNSGKPLTPGNDTTIKVYGTGWFYNGTSNTAMVWKDGTGSLLPPMTTADSSSFGWGIAVSGSDVYVSGSSPHGAVEWKNGVEEVLSATGQGYGMALAGSDVYVAGTQLIPTSLPNTTAIYWKNGQPTILSPELPTSGSNGVLVDGSDVYVFGYGLKNGVYYRALYWKNGTEVWMNPDTAGSPESILKNGSDIYLTGSLNAKAAVYWKNGQMTVLSSDTLEQADASGIGIIGNDIYVAGTIYNRLIADYNAVYWKNGQMIYLTDPSVPSQSASITISGNDIYISGQAKGTDGHIHAVYWKNGKMTQLNYAGATGDENLTGIVVTAG